MHTCTLHSDYTGVDNKNLPWYTIGEDGGNARLENARLKLQAVSKLSKKK